MIFSLLPFSSTFSSLFIRFYFHLLHARTKQLQYFNSELLSSLSFLMTLIPELEIKVKCKWERENPVCKGGKSKVKNAQYVCQSSCKVWVISKTLKSQFTLEWIILKSSGELIKWTLINRKYMLTRNPWRLH